MGIMERPENKTEKKQAKIHVFWETFTFQAILCVTMAILLVVFGMFFPVYKQTIQAEYQNYQKESHDYWNDIENLWGKIKEWLPSLKPIRQKDQELTGAGGEPNPFGPYNKVMAPPDYATFAPVILTTTITPPVTGRVTSHFGYRYHPITEELDFHKGIDVAAPYETPILAAINGIVAKTGTSETAGNYIILNHGNGLTTTYMHCSSILAQEGVHIREGEVIAKVGSTGLSTGNHLHFQMALHDVVFDPSWVVNLTSLQE